MRSRFLDIPAKCLQSAVKIMDLRLQNLVDKDEVGVGLGLEQRSGAIADDLGLIPEDDLETCHRNFDPPRRKWHPRFGTPRGTIWM